MAQATEKFELPCFNIFHAHGAVCVMLNALLTFSDLEILVTVAFSFKKWLWSVQENKVFTSFPGNVRFSEARTHSKLSVPTTEAFAGGFIGLQFFHSQNSFNK